MKGSYFNAAPLKKLRYLINLLNVVKLCPFWFYLHDFIRSLISPVFLKNSDVSECIKSPECLSQVSIYVSRFLILKSRVV